MYTTLKEISSQNDTNRYTKQSYKFIYTYFSKELLRNHRDFINQHGFGAPKLVDGPLVQAFQKRLPIKVAISHASKSVN